MISYCKGNSVLIQPKGRLDLEGGMGLRQKLTEVIGDRRDLCIVDMTDVEFIDSAGLTALIHGLNDALENRCRLTLHNPRPAVRLVFEITRLDQVFEIIETAELEHRFSTMPDRLTNPIPLVNAA
ncbi:MAG: STAS domain-containing protein [Oscillatoriales cyanobacterium C42_A2020_001]|nr:STAS domain-containing protein [Leptolyngbyaceae cyanobacterium C42_A2020_001]